MLRPELIEKAIDKIQVVRQRMKATQDMYKSYIDKRRWPFDFEIGDHVFLCISPTKGVYRFRVKGKLSLR